MGNAKAEFYTSWVVQPTVSKHLRMRVFLTEDNMLLWCNSCMGCIELWLQGSMSPVTMAVFLHTRQPGTLVWLHLIT